ncbi:MAG: signal recognition particle-docking protein FtsY [Candidatus ainarchaeum sp.]|nr:signal recognition particle-docking protein FtsY [Candidatus ainarchaeum sp.]
MFGFLKNKLNNFAEKLKNTIEKKEIIEEPENKIQEIKIEQDLTKKESIKPIFKEKKIIETLTKKDDENKLITNEEELVKVEKNQPINLEIITEENLIQSEEKELTNLEQITNQTPTQIEKNETVNLETINIKEIQDDKIKENQISVDLESNNTIISEEKEIEIKKEENKTKTDKGLFSFLKFNKKKEIENLNIDQKSNELINDKIKPKLEQKIQIKELKKVDEDKRELKAKVSTTGKLTSIFSGKIIIKESDISDLLFELELSLLESDVEQDCATEIISQIKQKLIGKEVSSKNINEILNEIIKEILIDLMKTNEIDLLNEIKNSEKPYKILMLGPNGAGKTTTLAKLTYYLKNNGLNCILAASDTFRSGAIDQLQEHANRLDVKLIKQQYGADPTAVAFDAMQSAKANNFDVLLIDSAGRQETNKNLMNELKKLERVIRPNLKIYVGEAYTGQGLLDMASEFNGMIGIDAFILTKIDADAKGGTTISLIYKLKKPILYIGTGQEYKDFEKFESKFILDRIL